MKTLGKLKLKSEKMLSHEELMDFRGGSGGSGCWRCKEEWQGYTYYRDCCGDYNSCLKCINTGTGCTVTCDAK